jgi:transposase
VRKLIADKTPDQLKMPYVLWTRAVVSQLNGQRFGIRLAVVTMGLYLARLGFTPQMPKKNAYEQSRAAVKNSLEEEYSGIAASARLILDNLRVHHRKPVKELLAVNRYAVEVFYLPSYSAELNPDEMANADLKQAMTKQAPGRTKLQLVKATAMHLRSVQRQPDRFSRRRGCLIQSLKNAHLSIRKRPLSQPIRKHEHLMWRPKLSSLPRAQSGSVAVAPMVSVRG